MFELKKIEAEWRARMHKALSFDGVDDYVEVPDSPTIRDWPDGITVICWVKSNTTLWNTWGMLVSKRDSFVLHPHKDTKDITFSIIHNDGTSLNVRTTADVDLTQWNMWFGLYDLHKISIGWNGKIKKTEEEEGDIAHDEGFIVIGRDDGYGGRFFDGLIAQVLIYHRALSPSEIKYLYHNPFDPIDPEHLVLWLNPAGIDVANSKWWDLSGKGNHGDIVGATEVKLVEDEVIVK